jgi:hypothetical protein
MYKCYNRNSMSLVCKFDRVFSYYVRIVVKFYMFGVNYHHPVIIVGYISSILLLREREIF